MNPKKIEQARDEAIRFLARVTAAEAAFATRKTKDGHTYVTNTNTVATAALKRASMDLTRSLADLRRPS